MGSTIGFVDGETLATSGVSGSPTLTTTATASSAPNTYAIAAGAGTLTAVNYAFTFLPGTLTVTPAPLTIRADDKSKVYGGALPLLTASYSGFVNGETSDTLTAQPSLTTTATPASHVDVYSITASGAADPDYTIAYAAGTLTITPATLLVTADDKTRVYGQANPPLTGTLTGVVNGDNITTRFATTALLGSDVTPAGYAIAPILSDPDRLLGNYSLDVRPGTLTVIRADTTVSLAPLSPVVYGQSVPFTATVKAVLPSTLTPGGTVTFRDGTTDLGTITLDASGRASLTVPSLAVGSHSITAVYRGNNDDNGSTSPPLIQQVVPQLTPQATLSGDASGVRGQVRSLVLGVANPAQPGTVYTWRMNWGDGSPVQTIQATAGTVVSHAFAEIGSYTARVTAAQGGLVGPEASQVIQIAAWAIQTDPLDGKRDLVVGSGAHNSEVEIEKLADEHGRPGGLVVEIENRATERYELQAIVTGQVDRIILFGQAADQLTVASNVVIDAEIHAGNGNSILQGGGGNNVLIGGAGDDVLIGGKGRDILIGGLGADWLIAGKGEDVLIAGKTDLDANMVAMRMVVAEWRSGRDYLTRAHDLLGDSPSASRLNGEYFLNASTVHDDGCRDVLIGGPGRDWFFLNVDGDGGVKDIVIGATRDERQTDVDVPSGH